MNTFVFTESGEKGRCLIVADFIESIEIGDEEVDGVIYFCSGRVRSVSYQTASRLFDLLSQTGKYWEEYQAEFFAKEEQEVSRIAQQLMEDS